MDRLADERCPNCSLYFINDKHECKSKIDNEELLAQIRKIVREELDRKVSPRSCRHTPLEHFLIEHKLWQTNHRFTN